MPRPNFDKTIRYHWLTACADPDAPTVTEIDAGTDLTDSILPDQSYGFTEPDPASVPQRSLASDYEAEDWGVRGNAGGQLMLFANDDAASDDHTNIELFGTHAQDGFIVERMHPDTPATVAAGDLCNVYTVSATIAHLGGHGPNTKQRYEVKFKTTTAPSERVAVVV